MTEITPLKKYIDKIGANLSKFAEHSRLPISTVHRIMNGKNLPSYTTARKIVSATKNELTLEDFGFSKKTRKRARADQPERIDDTGKADTVAIS